MQPTEASARTSSSCSSNKQQQLCAEQQCSAEWQFCTEQQCCTEWSPRIEEQCCTGQESCIEHQSCRGPRAALNISPGQTGDRSTINETTRSYWRGRTFPSMHRALMGDLHIDGFLFAMCVIFWGWDA